MDMQNVSNLQIPEGAVRTIHDKDSRLIWGRVAYSTKYAGDTYQQMYSGKNLWNAVIEVSGWSASGGSLANTARARSRTKVTVQPNTEYTLSMVPRDAGKTINMTVQGWAADNTFIIQITGPDWVLVPVTFTTPANCTQITISGRYSDNTSFGTLYSETDVFQNIQLETGSQATSYEPYVGGIPAPSPDYPQAVQTVTGEQTVTVSDGVDSEDFTISLGSIELCKIGNYQDYIYKSGDDWYVHKLIGKNVTDGNTEWTKSAYGTNTYSFNPSPATYYSGTVADTVCAKSDCFTGVSYNDRTIVMDNIVYTAQSNTIVVRNTKFDTKEELTTFCTSSPITFYYLTGATDTKITDATLVGQLNAVHEWLTRYGYNSTVAGSLPIIITKTNL